MQGQEQRRLPPPRQLDPVAERDEDVARAGQRHPAAAAGLQLPLEFQRRGQGDALLLRPARADRAGILAAMAGVEHHQRQRPARHRGGGQAAAIRQPGESGRPGPAPADHQSPAGNPGPRRRHRAGQQDHKLLSRTAPCRSIDSTSPAPGCRAGPRQGRFGRSSSSRGGPSRAVSRQAVGRSRVQGDSGRGPVRPPGKARQAGLPAASRARPRGQREPPGQATPAGPSPDPDPPPRPDSPGPAGSDRRMDAPSPEDAPKL